MSELQISQGCFRLSDTQTLILPALHIQAGDCWAFVGANGSGKSALAKALSGELALLEGGQPPKPLPPWRAFIIRTTTATGQ